MQDYMQAYKLYASASDLWRFGLPANTLFCDPAIESGGWSLPIKTSGIGQGIFSVDESSVPLDDFSVVVKCVASGDLNVDGFINPGPAPKFIISLDGGNKFSAPIDPKTPIGLLTPADTNIIDYPKGGFRLLLQNNKSYPSFVAMGDVWEFDTYVSPDIVQYLSSASRLVENYLQDTYQLPYTSWGDDLRRVVCRLAAWYFIQRRGLHQGQDIKNFEPKEEMAWLKAVSKGDIQPAIIEKNASKTFGSVLKARPSMQTGWVY